MACKEMINQGGRREASGAGAGGSVVVAGEMVASGMSFALCLTRRGDIHTQLVTQNMTFLVFKN